LHEAALVYKHGYEDMSPLQLVVKQWYNSRDTHSLAEDWNIPAHLKGLRRQAHIRKHSPLSRALFNSLLELHVCCLVVQGVLRISIIGIRQQALV
jgi:hypothetical protein